MQPEFLVHLYHEMLFIRMVEEKIAERYPEQEMRCPVHLCIGQEAVAVGVCAALAPEDYAMGTHRAHGHYLAKGGNLSAMLAELYGKETGCCGGRGGSMHLIDPTVGFLGAVPIVGSTLPIAVGAAFGSVMKGENRVMAVFFGEGATEEGVFHESINFAMLKNLPVVFICENNLYSVYSPLSVRQPDREVFLQAKGQGMESLQGDGNDVQTVYQLTAQAVQKARQGGGPTFLEFATYRWREHCGPYYDNDLGYRNTPTEYEEWRQRCPVTNFQAQLLTGGIVSQADLDAMAQALTKEIEEAFTFAKESPLPDPSTVWDHLYAP